MRTRIPWEIWQGDRYMYGDRYVQNNFAEINTEAPENVGKLSGDRNNNIQGDMPYTGSLYTGLTALSRHIWELYYTNRQIVLIPQNILTYIKASVSHSDHWNFTGNLAIHWISLQEGIPRHSLFIVCSWRMIQRLLEMVL